MLRCCKRTKCENCGNIHCCFQTLLLGKHFMLWFELFEPRRAAATVAAATVAAANRHFRFHAFPPWMCSESFSLRSRVSRMFIYVLILNMWRKPGEAPVVCLRATWTKYAPDRVAFASCSRCLASAWGTPLTECTRSGRSCYSHFIICNPYPLINSLQLFIDSCFVFVFFSASR